MNQYIIASASRSAFDDQLLKYRDQYYQAEVADEEQLERRFLQGSPYMQNYYSTTYGLKYSSTAQDVTYTNAYWDPQTNLTFQPLTQYYKPENFTASEAYYSTVYKQNYSDGYGFNFYTKKYGYYQYTALD